MSLSYAMLVLNWARETFGPVAMNPKERSLRIVEEACEVAQADGVPAGMLHLIINRTYSRPADTVVKELGGLLVTVYARCGLQGCDPEHLLSKEIERVLSKPKKHWQDKHDAKVAAGTTTGGDGSMKRLALLTLLALAACDSQSENIKRCTVKGGHMVMLMAAERFGHPWLCARIEIIDIGSK